MIADLIRTNRSYRRFDQSQPVSMETLRELVNLARLSPSARNAQPLKYILSCDPEKNRIIFQHLAWAAYLTDWPGPVEGEQPAAYIVFLLDTQISPSANCDHGIAVQSILLGAAEQGLGGCIVASIQKAKLAEALSVPGQYEILFVVGLGVPRETVVIEPLGADGNFKYWRDEQGVHHVPKRSLDDLILDR